MKRFQGGTSPPRYRESDDPADLRPGGVPVVFLSIGARCAPSQTAEVCGPWPTLGFLGSDDTSNMAESMKNPAKFKE